MKIGIDYSPVSDTAAGVGQFTKYLVDELAISSTDHEYFFYTDSHEFTKLGANFVYVSKPKGPGGGLRWMKKVRDHLVANKIDVFISTTSLTFPLFFNNTIQVVHDLSPLLFPRGFSSKKRAIYKLGLSVTARYAKGIFFISHTVQKEFNARFKSNAKQEYCLLGLNKFVQMTLEEKECEIIKEKLNLPEKYLLSISTLEPRKNYENMIRAYAKFHEDNPEYYYLIAGKKGWMYSQIFELVKELGLQDKVIFLGYISEREKYVLIRESAAFLYVSFYEGFGLPNIEAKAFGKPVVTSDIPVMREVMENDAVYADPGKVENIVKAIQKALDSKDNSVGSIAERFSWANVARKLIGLAETM